ncbi:unnamed protein product [Closterium sp. NIES-53]
MVLCSEFRHQKHLSLLILLCTQRSRLHFIITLWLRGSRSKAVIDPPASSAVDNDVTTTDAPALMTNKGSNFNFEDAANSQPVAGGSGLTVADKVADNADKGKAASVDPSIDDDGFIDDSDDDMEMDLSLEAECRLRTAIILLIPFALHKEISGIIFAIRMLIKRGWNAELSTEASTPSTKFQGLPAAYFAKEHFCRLQVSFVLESDADVVKRKDVMYQRLKGDLVTLHWQHTEDAAVKKQ